MIVSADQEITPTATYNMFPNCVGNLMSLLLGSLRVKLLTSLSINNKINKKNYFVKHNKMFNNNAGRIVSKNNTLVAYTIH